MAIKREDRPITTDKESAISLSVCVMCTFRDYMLSRLREISPQI